MQSILEALSSVFYSNKLNFVIKKRYVCVDIISDAGCHAGIVGNLHGHHPNDRRYCYQSIGTDHLIKVTQRWH